MSYTRQRIPPVPQSDWTFAVREVFAVMEGLQAAENGTSANAVVTLANHPPLGKAVLTFHMRFLGLLKDKRALREIIILRVSWIRQCQYEWVHHCMMAEAQAGLTKAHIEAVRQGSENPIWSDLERLVLCAVDELCETARLADETWARLSDKLTRNEMMEVIFLAGEYEMICRCFNALRVEVEPQFRTDSMPEA